ncbi:MAG: hypothetical protein EKK37_05430 [Sphingobacteriales bacterium]|nr:MAG: hypothetical protein EKK37_05430 [Sphingobacteriales bacterium]
MKKAISKLPASEEAMLVVLTTQTSIQQTTTHHHSKTACKNLTPSGYCTVCKRQCPAATINSSFNQ